MTHCLSAEPRSSCNFWRQRLDRALLLLVSCVARPSLLIHALGPAEFKVSPFLNEPNSGGLSSFSAVVVGTAHGAVRTENYGRQWRPRRRRRGPPLRVCFAILKGGVGHGTARRRSVGEENRLPRRPVELASSGGAEANAHEGANTEKRIFVARGSVADGIAICTLGMKAR